MNNKHVQFVKRTTEQMKKHAGCVVTVQAYEDQPANVLFISFLTALCESTLKNEEHYVGEEIIPTNGYPSYVINLLYEMLIRRKGRIKFYDDSEMAVLDLDVKRRGFLHEWNN